ncbi:MAG: hypothetical protein JO307_05435 [Bryobacterales bacterium]|nr:hypothetical protein [Bryobacterales bacterium]
MLFIAGVLLASAAVVFRWVDLRRSSADATRQDSPAALRTGFSANPDGSSWKLTWNSAAVLAMNPTGATLFIQDGGDEQDVPLTMADLSGGTIYYSAKSGELAFRLQVRRNGASVAEERVRVLDKIKSIARTPQQTQLSNDSTYLLPGSQRMAGRAQFEASSASENPATPSEADRRLSATATRKFIPPKSVSAPPPSNPILGAAGPISATALPVSPAVSTSFAAPPPPPAATAAPPPPAATIAASPAAPATSQPQSVSPVVPVAGTPPQYNFQAPRPVKQVQPVAPPDARAAGGTQITVVVSIDAKGKVLKATPTGRVEDFYLFGVAIRAARLWEFEPARLNGKAVPSEISLIFRF